MKWAQRGTPAEMQRSSTHRTCKQRHLHKQHTHVSKVLQVEALQIYSHLSCYLQLGCINSAVWSARLQKPLGQSTFQHPPRWHVTIWSHHWRALQKESTTTQPVHSKCKPHVKNEKKKKERYLSVNETFPFFFFLTIPIPNGMGNWHICEGTINA